MILKFIQAESKQPVLIMRDAIVSVAAHPTPGWSFVATTNGVAFTVLGTVEQILAEFIDQTGLPTVAIAPVG